MDRLASCIRTWALAGLLAVVAATPSAGQNSFTFTQIEVPGALAITEPQGINDAGQIVGWFSDGNGIHAFLYSGGTFTQIDFPGATATRFSGINNRGQIVGSFDVSFPGSLCCTHGFLYVDGTFTQIDVPGAVSTALGGINDAGQIIGVHATFVPGCGCDAGSVFLYFGGTFTDVNIPAGTLPLLGIFGTTFDSINNLGQIVGFFGDDNGSRHGILNVDGINTVIDVPGADSTVALGINDAGQIVGWFSDGNGIHAFLYSGGTFTQIDFPGATATRFSGINNRGQIVGSFYLSRSHGFLATLAPLYDPVPDLLNGQTVTTNIADLATKGRKVQGVAADGVSQIVLKIPAHSVGDQFVLTVMNDQGAASTSVDEDGAVADVMAPSYGSSTTVSAVATANTFTAFALYQAPADFPRVSVDDSASANRQVLISVQCNGQSCGSIPVKVVRPPVTLIHGLWSSSQTWNFFTPIAPGSAVARSLGLQIIPVDYHQYEDFGILVSAGAVVDQLGRQLSAFKTSRNVAAIQFDMVTHSMGGLVARTIATLPEARAQSYGMGLIHKLFTLDTPHTGSEFANALLSSGALCRGLFGALGKPIAENVVDLSVGSSWLEFLKRPIDGTPTHVFASTANLTQALSTEGIVRALGRGTVCSDLLPPLGFAQLFGEPNDLIVSLESQLGVGVPFPGEPLPPADTFAGTVHTVIPFLFQFGPDVLERDVILFTVGPSNGSLPLSGARVLQLLNQPVYGPAFGWISP